MFLYVLKVEKCQCFSYLSFDYFPRHMSLEVPHISMAIMSTVFEVGKGVPSKSDLNLT